MEYDKVERLIALAQLDIDAILAYDQAIKNIEEIDIRRALESFRSDHYRHVDELTDAIEHFGSEPPAFGRDLKGFLIEGMTAIASRSGTKGALMAMVGNETLTNARYKAALSTYFPPYIMQMIQNGYKDEQRHLAYVRSVLKEDFHANQPDPYLQHASGGFDVQAHI